MKIEFSNEAKELLQKQYEQGMKLYLFYDTEGVCGVNGIPTVRWITSLPDNAENVETDTFPTYINREQKVFFYKELRLDVRGSLFRLYSKEGILNPSITINN
ncbi:iron-sulfur cluster biosynthesis family protein [Oceanobacillus sp. 1P07AA]|uniref:iron-sulfur cluster biosynthesis family protein n=1 Tax=Oceanobacillus sp. 1P07AA TaxID=3132293 RepID=UPI0039A68DB4